MPTSPKLVNPHLTKVILEKYNISLTKRLGQHFLVDANILRKELEAAELSKRDIVIEVGPGIGTLTQALADLASRVIAIEVDKKFIKILSETLSSYSNVEIIQADALRFDFSSILQIQDRVGKSDKLPYPSAKLVSNLPYNIATPLIVKVLEKFPQIRVMVVMVQKEIAERMAASPGSKDYGLFTLKVHYYANVKKIAHVSRHVFIPEPKVDSAIVRLDRLDNPRVKVSDEISFFNLIEVLFQHRRKTLRSVLLHQEKLPYDRQRILKALERLEIKGIKPTLRSESLDLRDFALLYQCLESPH